MKKSISKLRLHVVLILCVLSVSIALYYYPFQRQFGFVFLLVVSFFSFFSPYAGITLIAAVIDMPDITGAPLTNVQIVITAFLINWLITGRIFKMLKISKKIVIPFLFLLFWAMLVSLVHSNIGFMLMILKVFCFVVIMYNLCVYPGTKMSLCYLAFLLGLLPSISTFWFHLLGVKVKAVMLWRAGFLRISAHDPNATAINLGAALVGFFFLFILNNQIANTGKVVFRYLVFILLVILLFPAFIFTMSRAAIVGSGFALITGLSLLILQKKIRTKSFLGVIFIVIMTIFIVFAFDHIINLGFLETIHNLYKFSRYSSEGARALSVKLKLWGEALSVMSEAPLFGIRNMGVFREKNIFGIDIHNTFLDYGVFLGIPGFMMFLLITFYPFIKAISSLNTIYSSFLFIALIVYIFCLFTINFISVPGNKVFWISWTMLLVFTLRKNVN